MSSITAIFTIKFTRINKLHKEAILRYLSWSQMSTSTVQLHSKHKIFLKSIKTPPNIFRDIWYSKKIFINLTRKLISINHYQVDKLKLFHFWEVAVVSSCPNTIWTLRISHLITKCCFQTTCQGKLLTIFWPSIQILSQFTLKSTSSCRYFKASGLSTVMASSTWMSRKTISSCWKDWFARYLILENLIIIKFVEKITNPNTLAFMRLLKSSLQQMEEYSLRNLKFFLPESWFIKFCSINTLTIFPIKVHLKNPILSLLWGIKLSIYPNKLKNTAIKIWLRSFTNWSSGA